MTLTLEPLPAREAIAFWQDKVPMGAGAFAALSAEEKLHAFAVSGIAKGDELDSIYEALQRAIDDGISYGEFKKQCADIFTRRGWTGKRDWRVQNIFRTNIQTAYNVGRWQRQQQSAGSFPYLMYNAVNDSRTRPTHRALDGKVFPADHPFWDTWYPPNGFRCRCSTISLTEGQVKRRGLRVETEDPTNTPTLIPHPVTGEKIHLQQLLPDPGFAGNPGKSRAAALLTTLAQRAEQWTDAVAAPVLGGLLSGEGFALWYRKPTGVWPVAKLNSAQAAAVAAPTRTVLLPAETAARLRRDHPELTSTDFLLVQRALDQGQRRDTEAGPIFTLETGDAVVTVTLTTGSDGLRIVGLEKRSLSEPGS
ncbi:phage head morphogenesis protein [Desulfofustis limnaeus]|uniref:Phage head morphogenesis domain-containing protein n=1 Tax=Desulfofustis limnaeus TaxID=2740163 RepID=A0ABN6MBL7_9BACT|nr:phage head morphogenesis protein [Desulfofustis limnaeus]BDD88877.1 hypothetical protein DPPLL_32420 [Desulfofustis limnaeus]